MSHTVEREKGIYACWGKRLLDVLLSGCGLVILSPVFLVIAILVRVKLGSPVLFCQARPGKDEQLFNLYKFRSMTDARDENGAFLPDEVRLTKFGRILRSTSLDELPELWNILKGDMSIVGPRPLIPEYLPYYTEEEHHRHDVRPGLTGLAQVSGRSFLTWEEIFALDLQYIGEISFVTDIKIICHTAEKVLKRADVADVTDAVRDDQENCYVYDGESLRKLHLPLSEERRNRRCNVK